MWRALFALAVAACYQPSAIESCEITCNDFASTASRAPCPTGLTCASSGYCVETSDPICAPRLTAVAGQKFGMPVLVGGTLLTTDEEDDPSLTEDLRELYMLSATDLYVATRATSGDPWTQPARVVELNTPLTEQRPRISSDGLTIYFARRAGVDLPYDIYVSTRTARGEAWAPPVPIAGDVNTTGADEIPSWVSPDGLTLLFEAPAPGGGENDLYLARRPTLDAEFVREAPLSINSSSHDGGGWFDASGTILVFESRRSGNTAIWEAYREGEVWTTVLRSELDTPVTDGTPWLSPDGRTIVYSSNGPALPNDDDLYIATR